MSKFKVGDRVVVYSNGRDIGEIVGFDKNNMPTISGREGAYYHVHPKQLRRLKPKAKPIEFECEWYQCTAFSGARIIHPGTCKNYLTEAFIGKRTKVRVTVIG